jgi:hypothetical protein
MARTKQSARVGHPPRPRMRFARQMLRIPIEASSEDESEDQSDPDDNAEAPEVCTKGDTVASTDETPQEQCPAPAIQHSTEQPVSLAQQVHSQQSSVFDDLLQGQAPVLLTSSSAHQHRLPNKLASVKRSCDLCLNDTQPSSTKKRRK